MFSVTVRKDLFNFFLLKFYLMEVNLDSLVRERHVSGDPKEKCKENLNICKMPNKSVVLNVCVTLI